MLAEPTSLMPHYTIPKPPGLYPFELSPLSPLTVLLIAILSPFLFPVPPVSVLTKRYKIVFKKNKSQILVPSHVLFNQI